MESKLKLSNTQLDLFALCPAKYKLRYIDGIKEEKVGSALVFGGAIDLGLNVLLQGKSVEEANKAFVDAFTYHIINNKKEHVPESDKVTYFKKDLNLALIKDGEPIHPWYSLKNLGLMMISAYKEKAIPRIQKVHFIQKEILVKSDTEDVIAGVADFGATIDDFKRVVIDNKTSSKKYALDSVKTSQQLSLYQYALNADKACYIVLIKDPIKTSIKVCEACGDSVTNSKVKTCNSILKDTKKRCNGTLKDTITLSIDVQIIIDDVSEETTNKMLEDFSTLSYNIRTGNFEHNWSACEYQWGKRCGYYEYCKNNDMTGLIKTK